MDNELYHYGILGMKWGVRRTPEQLGRKPSSKKKSSGKSDDKEQKKAESQSESKPKKKSAKEMTDEELAAAIKRLQMEKQYKDLMRSENPEKNSKAKAFVKDVLEKSGKNIATQATTYVMGTMVNKALEDVFKDPQVVNPKKGQKDK